MKIFSTLSPLNVIIPENNLEKELLDAKIIGSKICYKIGRRRDNNSRELTVKIVDCGNSWVSIKKGIAVLKVFPNDFKKSSYVLRFALDAFSVSNGCLPLHVASLIIKNKTIFLFGDTFCGKSTIMHHYCSIYPGTPIGDDHVIIGNDHVVGNRVTRLRNSQSVEKFVVRKMIIHPFFKYLIFVVKLNNENYCKRISASELLQSYDCQRYVLKYLHSKLKEDNGNIALDKSIDVSIKNDYQKSFIDFIGNSSSIYVLSGKLDFVLEKIKNIVVNPSN